MLGAIPTITGVFSMFLHILNFCTVLLLRCRKTAAFAAGEQLQSLGQSLH